MNYVGDAVAVTFSTTPGATVTVTWIDPDGQVVTAATPVAESPPGSGTFPTVLTPSSAGVWEARFTATGAATETEPYYLRALPLGGPPPLATVGEVVDLYRPLTVAEEGLTKALLRKASAMVRGRFPDIAARIAAGTADAELVALAVVSMVVRVLRNPEALRAETTGPFSRTYDVTVAAGHLVISDTDLEVLAPPAQASGEPAGSIVGTASLMGVEWGSGCLTGTTLGVRDAGW